MCNINCTQFVNFYGAYISTAKSIGWKRVRHQAQKAMGNASIMHNANSHESPMLGICMRLQNDNLQIIAHLMNNTGRISQNHQIQ